MYLEVNCNDGFKGTARSSELSLKINEYGRNMLRIQSWPFISRKCNKEDSANFGTLEILEVNDFHLISSPILPEILP